MSVSEFDSYRPPEPAGGRKKRRRGGGASSGAGSAAGAQGGADAQAGGQRSAGGRGRGWANRGAEGNREMPMVEDVEFTSYYGRPIVKAPPWGDEISAYLFLGGLAGGSTLLALGAHLTDRPVMRMTARFTALGATALGGLALIEDLGRPERFLNMMRTVKVTSPMSLGTWILSGFGAGAGTTAVIEVDRLTGERLPLGPLRRVLHALETPAAIESALFAAPLAAYTGVLLGATAVPTWNAAGRNGLPLVFVSSASVAAGGAAMMTAPVREAGPARLMALAGAAGDVVAMGAMKKRMHPVEVEPMETGEPGRKLHRAERLLLAGAVGAAAVEVGARLLRRKLDGAGGTSAASTSAAGAGAAAAAHAVAGAAASAVSKGAGAGRLGGLLRPGWKTRTVLRAASVVSGAALAAASAYTRFGVLEAGIESTKDPRHVVEPQRARLEARRARGITHDSITTAG
ncbi:NrfD/PsrC family molybdoenzyme membrane anchor subunit [Brevibacterium album]|uniref:NrfD/PsrC family molybdoenzyme membrane anchor subunit n=1 Tax=Brevibacterium album TaxID=417948 RepID=UPI00041B5313|nr:NrfD/PsrC family molybdoenzyme membrane anchor subunit [Brevibacterium album]